jgi:ATP-dependent RNA helicase DDX3X
MSDTWNTSEMRDSLPESHNQDADAVGAASNQNGSVANGSENGEFSNTASTLKNMGWIKAEAYDYTALVGPDHDEAWDGSARIYEWDGEMGEVGPEHPELELDLFGTPESRKEVCGLDFTR